jgi:NTP pyrophosphatase (non-canonical NTP hydrolase)
MNLFDWQKRLQEFAAERHWESFLNPKNLAMALSVESAELLECYQWLTPEESLQPSRAQQLAIADEMADVLMYLLQLSRVNGVDLEQAMEAKLLKNAVKHPKP